MDRIDTRTSLIHLGATPDLPRHSTPTICTIAWQLGHSLDVDTSALREAVSGGRQRDRLVVGVERALDSHRLVRLLHDGRVLLYHHVVHVPAAALRRGHTEVTEMPQASHESRTTVAHM